MRRTVLTILTPPHMQGQRTAAMASARAVAASHPRHPVAAAAAVIFDAGVAARTDTSAADAVEDAVIVAAEGVTQACAPRCTSHRRRALLRQLLNVGPVIRLPIGSEMSIVGRVHAGLSAEKRHSMAKASERSRQSSSAVGKELGGLLAAHARCRHVPLLRRCMKLHMHLALTMTLWCLRRLNCKKLYLLSASKLMLL